jgi:outer membrane protein assembly factor BamB
VRRSGIGRQGGWLAAVLLLGAATLRGEDWPRFRGPNGAGVADGAALPGELLPTKNALWKIALPPGYSSPVIFGDRIYLTAFEGDALLTLCLRRSDGSTLWRREAPRPRKESLDDRNGPASPSPAADAAGVVVFFADFGLLAYDHNGRERWRAPLGPFGNVYGMGASPILVEDVVILVCDQGVGSFIAAFDAASGRERWRTARPEAVSGHSTPIVRPRSSSPGPVEVLAPGSFRLGAYDPKTGELLWWADGLPSEMKSGPLLGEGNVLVVGYSSPANEPGKQVVLPPFEEWKTSRDTDGDGRVGKGEADDTTREMFQFVDLDHDGFISAAEWRTNQASALAENGLLALRFGSQGPLGPGGLLWKHQRSVPQLPTPVLYRGIVYMINDGGILTTIDGQTGAALKQGRLREAIDHYYASPVAGDGKVYLASRTGLVSVLRAGPEQEVLSVTDLDDEIAATPALADGRVYLRTRGALYCFGSAAGASR